MATSTTKKGFMDIVMLPVDWSRAEIEVHDSKEDYEKDDAKIVIVVPLTKKEIVEED